MVGSFASSTEMKTMKPLGMITNIEIYNKGKNYLNLFIYFFLLQSLSMK